MKKKLIYSMKSPYREELKVWGYHFGKEEPSACIVGSMRGNEIQQMYVCSQLIRRLHELEQKGGIVSDNGILVIPAVNYYAENIGKRFWPADNRDINRMFPGNHAGETTERIAAGVFEQIRGYNYGIQLASFYRPGDFVPHVRMMETGYQSASLANLFGLPFVVVRKPQPIDTATLNYNWQMCKTNAFSVYTRETDRIDEESAGQAVSAILRFLTRMGIVRYNSHSGYIASVINEGDLMAVYSGCGGIYRRCKDPGQEVRQGEKIAEVLHPYEGNVIETIEAPCDGIVFFAYKKPLVNEHEIVYQIIKRMHE